MTYKKIKYFYHNVASEFSKGALWFGLALAISSGSLMLSVLIFLPVIGTLFLDYHNAKGKKNG